ncbi:hypothetical protein [Nocardia fluminea]|uniref:hypothetical protein n=1 Tax=Nocardia fluminea TaxID=134984 RepID=UPI0033C0F82A
MKDEVAATGEVLAGPGVHPVARDELDLELSDLARLLADALGKVMPADELTEAGVCLPAPRREVR